MTATEYAFIIAVLILGVVGAISALGGRVCEAFATVDGGIPIL